MTEVPHGSRQGLDVLIGLVGAVCEFVLAVDRGSKNLRERKSVFSTVNTDLPASFVDASKN
jgi:hypothetical protein